MKKLLVLLFAISAIALTSCNSTGTAESLEIAIDSTIVDTTCVNIDTCVAKVDTCAVKVVVK